MSEIPKEVKEFLELTDDNREELKFNSSDKLKAGIVYSQVEKHLVKAVMELNLLGAFLAEEMETSKPAALLALTITTDFVEAGEKLMRAQKLARKTIEKAMED